MSQDLQLSTQAGDDDLFTRPPRSARRQAPIDTTARRTCVACTLTYVVPLDYAGPRLCDGCRSDIAATRALIRYQLDANIAPARAALDAWDRVREPQQAAWERVQDARETDPAFAQKAIAHQRAGNVYGKLLDAEDAYVRAVLALEAERQRL